MTWRAVAARRTNIARAVLALLLFVATFAYRFNTLGGRFGGFENDHFVSFAYAKQVEAGAEPLRDFAGLGLQGAWPSLTYEASAAAQRLLGDNLRSEALLTVTGVALAAALTFLAATMMSTAGWALVVTLLSVFIAPTLYNYTKVLPFAAAAVAIASYVGRPTLWTVVVMAVVSAVAFLLRHDLAAYIGSGVLVATLITGPRRLRLRHTVAYLALTLVLLLPSLSYVQYHEGVVRYLIDGLALSQREAERTPFLEWPAFNVPPISGGGFVSRIFASEDNATAWLFYTTWLLVPAAMLLVWRQARRDQALWPAVVAIGVMLAFAARFMLRGNITARLGDIGPLYACLLAYTCHTLTKARHDGALPRRLLGAGLALVLMTGTVLSANTVGSVASQLRTSRLGESWQDVWQHAQNVSRELQADPQAEVEAATEGTPLWLAQYLNRCTDPADRIALMAYRPELLPFARRLFAAGRLSIMPLYVLDDRYQRAAIAFWQRERVPLALVGFDAFTDRTSTAAPVLRDFLLQHYVDAGVADPRDEHPLRVFLRRDLTPTSSFGSTRLPCLR